MWPRVEIVLQYCCLHNSMNTAIFYLMHDDHPCKLLPLNNIIKAISKHILSGFNRLDFLYKTHASCWTPGEYAHTLSTPPKCMTSSSLGRWNGPCWWWCEDDIGGGVQEACTAKIYECWFVGSGIGLVLYSTCNLPLHGGGLLVKYDTKWCLLQHWKVINWWAPGPRDDDNISIAEVQTAQLYSECIS